MILEIFSMSFAIIFVNELGDKSQIFAMTSSLAYRNHRLVVFLGGSLALVLCSALAAGTTYLLPVAWIPYLEKFTGAILCIFALLMLLHILFINIEYDGEKEVTARVDALPVFLTQFMIIFAMEFGDKTQLGIIALTLRYQTEWLSVLFGASVAFVLVQAFSVWGVRLVPRRFLKTLQIVGVGMLFLFGVALGDFS